MEGAETGDSGVHQKSLHDVQQYFNNCHQQGFCFSYKMGVSSRLTNWLMEHQIRTKQVSTQQTLH